MSRTTWLPGLFLLLAAPAVACADDPAAPAAVDPSATAAARSDVRLAGVVGLRLAGPCDRETDSPVLARLGGTDRTVVVDVEFGRPRAEPVAGQITDDEVAQIRRAGGTMLHRFQAPVARVEIALSRLDGLLDGEGWLSVRVVPDPARHDLVLALDLGRAPSDADRADLAALGVRVVDPRPAPEILIAAPDPSVPALARRFGSRLTLEPAYCALGD